MKLNIKSIFLISVICLVIGLIAYQSLIPKTPTSATSQVSSQTLIDNAKKDHHPAWLLFHSQTCASCVEMEKIYQALKPEFEGKISFVNLDVNNPLESKLLEQYQIQYIPTTYLLDGNGKIIGPYVGVIPIEEMRGKLNALLSGK